MASIFEPRYLQHTNKHDIKHICIFIHTLTLFLSATVSTASLERAFFAKQETCPGYVLRPEFCPNVDTTLSNWLQCASLCERTPACKTFLWDSLVSTCTTCTQLTDGQCSNAESGSSAVTAYEKHGVCDHGGTFQTDGSCLCVEPYGGEGCRTRMQDCQDWGEAGYSDGIRTIYPALSPAPFQAWCRMSLKRTYISSHTKWFSDFSRTWQEYRDGFGPLVHPGQGDHWIGLDHLHQLTTGRTYTAIFETYPNNSTYYQHRYLDFTVGALSDLYAFNFSSTTSGRGLGDCLGAVKGKPFSTYDADHDDDVSGNCASYHGAGWWFGGSGGAGTCSLCNPLGKIQNPLTGTLTGDPQEAFWYPGFSDIGDVAPKLFNIWLTR